MELEKCNRARDFKLFGGEIYRKISFALDAVFIKFKQVFDYVSVRKGWKKLFEKSIGKA